MASFDEATQNVAKFIKDNPGLFNGVLPGNVLGQLGVVNPGLFGQLQEAYNAGAPQGLSTLEKAGVLSNPFSAQAGLLSGAIGGAGAPTLTEWGKQNTAYGQGLLDPNYNGGIFLPKEAPAIAPVAAKPDTTAQDQFDADAQKRLAEYNKSVNDAYDQAGQGLVQSIQRGAAPGRSKVISEEAALGRLSSPVSIPQLSRYDEQTQNSIGNGLTQLAANKASGNVDLAKTIEGIMGSERAARTASNEFGQTMGLNREKMTNDIISQNNANSLAAMIGKMTAENQRKSGLEQAGGMLGSLGQLGQGAGGLISLGKSIGSLLS